MNQEDEVSINSNNTPEVKALNNNTFNKLKNIQNLLKKESALKELCKKIKIYINKKMRYIIYSYSN